MTRKEKLQQTKNLLIYGTSNKKIKYTLHNKRAQRDCMMKKRLCRQAISRTQKLY